MSAACLCASAIVRERRNIFNVSLSFFVVALVIPPTEED